MAEPAAAAAPDTSWDQLSDPALFLAMNDLSLAAHGIVEGALQGLHRSPFRGYGTEFDSHREYLPGDDLRYLNWNLYARHGRLFIKQFRTETNLHLYLLLDASGSMATKQGPATKYRYAARATAAFALLTRRSRDAAGLFLLHEGVSAALPPRTRPGHFEEICDLLETSKPTGPGHLGKAMDEISEACRKRGIVVVFSDFFDEEELLLQGLRALREQGHEVIAIQLLDPWECELPEDGDFEFADLETGETLKTSSPEIRAAYAKTVADWREHLRGECEAAGIQWLSLTTETPLADVLIQYLLRRSQTRDVR
jgi:uncharacterized protein (DUF58 family)